MPVYRIAELNILIDPIYDHTKKQLEPFITEIAEYDFEASASTDEIEHSHKTNPDPVPIALCEGAVVLTKICKTVLDKYDGFFFHSSSLLIDGGGVLFTAASGTGKSTHASLWRKLFGDRVTMINDDKPIIRKIDGKFYVCSTPWMGKSNIGANIIAPIKAIYVLRRGSENSADEVRPAEVFRELMEATLLPESKENMGKLLELYDGLFSSVKLIRLSCTPDIEAAQVAYNALKED